MVKRIGEILEAQGMPERTPGKARGGNSKSMAPHRTNPTYGRVFFALRRRFGISALACLLVDVVETLSRKTGWCFASRAYLADLLGVSLSSIKRLLGTLESKGLVERHPSHAGQVRPTSVWHRAKTDHESGQPDRPGGSI